MNITSLKEYFTNKPLNMGDIDLLISFSKDNKLSFFDFFKGDSEKRNLISVFYLLVNDKENKHESLLKEVWGFNGGIYKKDFMYFAKKNQRGRSLIIEDQEKPQEVFLTLLSGNQKELIGFVKNNMEILKDIPDLLMKQKDLISFSTIKRLKSVGVVFDEKIFKLVMNVTNMQQYPIDIFNFVLPLKNQVDKKLWDKTLIELILSNSHQIWKRNGKLIQDNILLLNHLNDRKLITLELLGEISARYGDESLKKE
jgi:hypothetical protein